MSIRYQMKSKYENHIVLGTNLVQYEKCKNNKNFYIISKNYLQQELQPLSKCFCRFFIVDFMKIQTKKFEETCKILKI